MTEFKDFDIAVVGSGFFGATIAERCASKLGLRVCVLERRTHIGGNAWSEVDPTTGIEVHSYGTHCFHCSSEDVWAYVNQFGKFSNYRHRVIVNHNDTFLTMPMNLGTLSSLFQKFLSPTDAREIIAKEVEEARIAEPQNLEDKAISLVGRTMYEALIKGYTKKQWQTDPKLLPPEIISRLPMRLTFDDSYFPDRYQGLPLEGFGTLIGAMFRNPRIDVHRGVDYFEVQRMFSTHIPIIYTGPIDRFFECRAGELGWRTLDFDREIVDVPDFQGTSVVNYPDPDVRFTRIHEFRHLHPERNYQRERTIVFREYSRSAQLGDEPYYPINTQRDKNRYNTYKELAGSIPNVIFGGRLGTYRYLDMHQAIGAALKTFENRLIPHFRDGRELKAGTGAPSGDPCIGA